jgi:hypothetical protein
MAGGEIFLGKELKTCGGKDVSTNYKTGQDALPGM